MIFFSQIWYQLCFLFHDSRWRYPHKSIYDSLLVTTITISLGHCIISNIHLSNCFFISYWRPLHSRTHFPSKPRLGQSWSNKLKPMGFCLCTCIGNVLLIFHFLVTEIIYCVYKIHVICKNFPS